MLSGHELKEAVVNDLFPRTQKIEEDVLNLFNRKFQPGRGPTGVQGQDELAWTISYLRSAANMLERLEKELK